MSRIALTDVETTGLRPSYHEIVEIACIVFDEETAEEVARFERKVWPKFPARMDKKAQQVNGYSADEWRAAGAVPLETAMKEYAAITDGCKLMAYNVAFDAGFIDAAALVAKVDLKMRRPSLDLLTMAYMKMPAKIRMFKMSMKAVCEHLGIPPEPAIHRAMNGVLAEFEIYKALTK